MRSISCVNSLLIEIELHFTCREQTSVSRSQKLNGFRNGWVEKCQAVESVVFAVFLLLTVSSLFIILIATLKVLLIFLEFYSETQGLSFFRSVSNILLHFYLLYLKKLYLQILISKLVEIIVVMKLSTQTGDRHNLPKNLLFDLIRTWSKTKLQNIFLRKCHHLPKHYLRIT